MRASAPLLLAAALVACEAQPTSAHHTPDHEPAAQPAGGSAAREYVVAMAKMHRDMGKASADSDESFMRMMIAHHQGAIDMAEIELKHGKDPEARRLAERVIRAQTAEIREIEAWIARRQGTQAAKR